MILGSSASSTYGGIIRIQDRNLVILGSSASTSDGIIQDPGPKSGRRITGGGSYVTACLVTLTTIPLARISPFPLVPSNGIICSNSVSASCLLVRQFPRGTSTSPHMSQHARIGDPGLPEALPCPIICFGTSHPLLFSDFPDFHIQVIESFLKTLKQRNWDILLSYIG